MADFRGLTAYQKGFKLAMRIKGISETFPPEEKYSLTDQIRRSSRSVCTNLAEGYRKRRYRAHFIAKISDSDMENTETQVWLDFAIACNYLSPGEHADFLSLSEEIGKLLNHILDHPDRYGA